MIPALSDLIGERTYFDTNIFVYLAEGYPQFAGVVEYFAHLIEAGQLAPITSELTLTEIQYSRASEDTNRALIEFVDRFSKAPINREQFIRAGELRIALGLKTPDALHIASAIGANCRFFLTNDKRIQGPA